jgi:hypothetical protein
MSDTETISASDIEVGDRLVVSPPTGRRFAMKVEHVYPMSPTGRRTVSGAIAFVNDLSVFTGQHKLESVGPRHKIERVR